MSTRARFLLLTVAVVAVAAAFGTWRTVVKKPSGPPPLQQVSLRLQWIHQAQFAGFYMAKDMGFFADEGLNVDIQPGGQDVNAATMVAAGSNTFGVWSADQILLAASKGAPLVPIGTIFRKSLTAFMVHADSNITTPKDFEGKTVGVYYGFDSETIYRALLDKYKVNPSKIHETALQYDLARFFNGDVDVWPAYVINQPLIAEQKGVKIRLLRPEDFGIHFYSDTLVARSDWLNEHPDVAVKFLRASARGWSYAIAHRDEAVDVVLKYDPTADKAQQRRMLDVVADYFNGQAEGHATFEMDPSIWTDIEMLLKAHASLRSDFEAGGIPNYDLAKRAATTENH